MNNIIIFILAVIAFTSATKWYQLDNYTFEHYQKEFGKKYSSQEEQLERKNIFEKTLERIKIHNADETKTWKEGVNQLTDRKPEEFQKRLGLRKDLLYSQKYARSEMETEVTDENIDITNIPTNVDWRQKGIISAVKDQGQCGSCWTFGTAETIESYWCMKTGELSDLSEQQILDCVPNPNQCGGTGGCQGGTPELAYAGIKSMGGLASEWTYSYSSYSGNNFNCKANLQNPIIPMVQLSNWTTLPSNKYLPVLNHLAYWGPLAVNVDASSWQNYESGVYNGCNQTNPDIDHVVQLVGYGTDPKSGDYWLVRNSWNPSWGEEGYIRLARKTTPECGVDIQPSDGTGCKNGPPSVTVCGTCAILYDTSFPTIA